MTPSTLLSTLSLAGLLLSGAASATPTNEQLVHALFEAFNAHDADAIGELYTADARVFSPEHCEPTVGAEAIAANYAKLFEQIPDVHDALQIMLSDGDRVAVVFTASSRIAGAEFSLPIAAVLRIEDGKVAEDRAFFQSDMPAECNGN